MDEVDLAEKRRQETWERAMLVSCVVCGAQEQQACSNGGICPSRGA